MKLKIIELIKTYKLTDEQLKTLLQQVDFTFDNIEYDNYNNIDPQEYVNELFETNNITMEKLNSSTSNQSHKAKPYSLMTFVLALLFLGAAISIFGEDFHLFWKLVPTVVLTYFGVKAFPRNRVWSSILLLFAVYSVYWAFDETRFFTIVRIICVIALLALAAIQFIPKKKKTYTYHSENSTWTNENPFAKNKTTGNHTEVSFTTNTLVIDNSTVDYSTFTTSFGETKLDAISLTIDKHINIENSFGSTVISVNADTKVVNNIKASMGAVEVPINNSVTTNTLYLNGKSSFGAVRVDIVA